MKGFHQSPNLRNVMILVKKGRYSLRNSNENVKTAANWVTSHHSAGPRWSKMTRMKLSAIIVRYQAIYKSSCFKLLRKRQTEGSGNYVVTRNGIAGSATDVVLNTYDCQ